VEAEAMTFMRSASNASLRAKTANSGTGALIVNADDWGQNRDTTGRTFECVLRGSVSSVSAMVFMEDSERAAAIALDRGIDTGLHLNLTAPFTAPGALTGLVEHQRQLSAYLLGHRYAQTVFHPGLVRSFAYSIAAQLTEFARLYGTEPRRIDGHHHMHLSSNVVLGKLLPAGTVVRRNFSFGPGERSLVNRMYRRTLDLALERRHYLADFMFSLPPLEPSVRLQKIFSLAQHFIVEVETHPVNPNEYRFLAEGKIFQWAGDLRVASGYTVPVGNLHSMGGKCQIGRESMH
jgi:chitin disaccharide deacetylase